MMATKKRASALPAQKKTRRTQPGRYRGLLVLARPGTRTKSNKSIDAGQILLAVENALDGGWVPVLYMGRVELVQQADLTRVPK